jgi:hypothetical protein
MQGKVRRVVTGHDEAGRAHIVSDGPAPQVHSDPKRPGHFSTEIWLIDRIPALLGSEPDPTERPRSLTPPANGATFRILELPPDRAFADTLDAEGVRDVFATMGTEGASTYRASARHPLMHRTESLDYGLILAGEIYLLVDDEEVLLREGDVVVQRGTNHAWSNRSDRPCRIAFFMIDGRFDPELQRRWREDAATPT